MIMRMFIQVPETFIVKRTPCQNRASCRGFNGRTLTFLIGCLLKNILILMMWSVCNVGKLAFIYGAVKQKLHLLVGVS